MTTYQSQQPQHLANCQCQCGTRISLDQQLINQRQQWKARYYSLQKQTSRQVGLLKEQIYKECSLLMQAEFLKKEKQHAQVVNQKSGEVQELMVRVIRLETGNKVLEKEKEVLIKRLEEEEKRFVEKLEEVTRLKDEHNRRLTRINEQNLTQTGVLKVRITEDYQTKIQQLNKQNQHLQHKLQQFQKKYSTIIPQVQKLKAALVKKSQQVQSLQTHKQKLQTTHTQQKQKLGRKIQQLQEVHAPCNGKLVQLTEKILLLQNELGRARLVKREVKVEPVFVDRPVEVERVVEKLIQVEKIVKQYIQPQEDYKQLCQDNKRLRSQLQAIVNQLHLFESRHQQLLIDTTDSHATYQQTIRKYKQQRETLVSRLHQQQKQLQQIYKMIDQQQYQGQKIQEPQRIVVQVSKDGVVSKRVEKINVEERVTATVNRQLEEKKTTENKGSRGVRTMTQEGRVTNTRRR